MARLTLVGLLAVPWLLLAPLVTGDAVLDLQNKGRPAIDARIAKSATCTKEKLRVRREWYVICSCDA
jgi:tyrosinase